jgi:hypothetical protein
MVGMQVRLNDIAHGQRRPGLDGGLEGGTLLRAAPRINDGYRLGAEDHAKIGDAAGVGGREILMQPNMDEHAGRHLNQVEWLGLGRCGQAGEDEKAGSETRRPQAQDLPSSTGVIIWRS